MFVNGIKHIFNCEVIYKELSPVPGLSLFYYLLYLISLLLKHTTLRLSDIKKSDLNLIRWL